MYIFSLCFSQSPSIWEHARPSFLYRPPGSEVCLSLEFKIFGNSLDLGHTWVSWLPGIVLKVDPALLCPSPTSIKGLPTSSKHNSLKCGCRYENYSINTTQLYVSTHVGVQNMSDNVFSCSGMSTYALVFSAWLWGWSGWEGFCFFFSSHLTNLPICCHHLLHPDCCRNPSFIACSHCWLVFFKLIHFCWSKIQRWWASQGLSWHTRSLTVSLRLWGNPSLVWGITSRQITVQIYHNVASARNRQLQVLQYHLLRPQERLEGQTVSCFTFIYLWRPWNSL